MPVYEFRCQVCGTFDSYISSISDYDPNHYLVCTGAPNFPHPVTRMHRQFSFAAGEIFYEHYNMSSGTVVRSKQELADDLARKSDTMSNRIGIEHNFQIQEAGDLKPPT